MTKIVITILVLIIFFSIMIFFIKNKRKKDYEIYIEKNTPKKINNISKNNNNFTDNKNIKNGIINEINKVELVNNTILNKPFGWVETKSYEDDVLELNHKKAQIKLTISKNENKDSLENLVEKNTIKYKKNTPTILIVDDSITVRNYISNIFASKKYEIIIKDNGLSALDYLKMTTKNPDIIITDLEMPKMNGVELIKIIKENKKFKKIPIIVVSANPTPHINLLYEKLVHGMLQKPFNEKELMEQVNYLLFL